MNRFFLVFAGLLSCLPGLQAASIDSLAGSYTNLPVERRELSLLHGAIALETGMLKRLYTIDGLSSPNKATRQLVHDIFYQIPDTEEFAVSKKIIENKDLLSTKIIPDIITNIAVLGLLEKIRSFTLEKQYKDPIRQKLKQQLKPIGNATSERFSSAQTEIAIAILSGALWFIKKTMPEPYFDYQEQLTETFDEIQEKILQPIAKENAQTALLAVLQPSLDTTPASSLTAEEYETKVIEILARLTGTAQHPEPLEQVSNAKVKINNQSFNFADCMETTMRNLINILAYNPETKNLSAKHLQTKFPNAHPELIAFYQHFPKFSKSPESSVESQKDQAAYNAWAQLVSNIPGVQYNEPKEDTKKTYELQPSYPNLLILTNYLLGLNWFANLQQYPKNPDNFTKTHSTKFINLFGTADEPITELKEYGTLTINTERGYAFTIDLTQGHGTMAYKEINRGLQEELHTDLFATYPQLYNLAALENWPKTPDSLWHLFSQPIEMYDFGGALAQKLKYIPFSWIPFLADLINKHPEENMKIRYTLKLYRAVLEKSWIQFNEKEKEISLTKMLTVAQNELNRTNDLMVMRELQKLFEALFKKSLGFEAAIKAVQAGMMSENKDIRNTALSLFSTLFSYNQGFNEAKSIIVQNIPSTNTPIQKDLLQLLQELFKKKKAFTEAVQAAQTLLNSNNANNRKLALEIFKELIENNQAFAETKEAINKGILDADEEIREITLQFSSELAKKDPTFTVEAINVATKGAADIKKDIKEKALNFFIELVKKNHALTEAIAAANHGFANSSTKYTALKLFIELVKKNHAFNEAATAAEQGIKDPSANLQDITLTLFLELIKKDQAFTKASAAATEIMNAPKKETTLKEKAIETFIELVIKNQAFTEALVAANKGLTHTSTKYMALKLLIELVKKDHAFDEAKAAAIKEIKEPFANLQDIALTLLRELVIKDQAFAEAIIAATIRPANSTLIKKHLQLLLELVNKNQALTQASSIATQSIRNGNYQDTALNILDIVLDKEKSLKIKIVDEISQLAIEKIESPFEHNKALELFKWLFQKKEGFQQAIQTAQKLSLSEKNNILERSLRLFNLLNEYGQALDKPSLQTREHIAQKLAAINKDLSNTSKFIRTTGKLLAGAAALGALAYGGYRWYTANQRTIAPTQQNQPLAWPWNITTRLGSVGTPTALPTPQPTTATMSSNAIAPLMTP